MTEQAGPNNLRVDQFDYHLPPELIAQTPLPDRAASRLLVIERQTGALHHSQIRELPRWLTPGDLVVVNNTRVLPARLHARKRDTGGRIELLLLREEAPGRWHSLAKPVRRLRPGSRLTLEPKQGDANPEIGLTVEEIRAEGEVVIAFAGGVTPALDPYGETPLPPYIKQPLADAERYQTVYARILGSAAAPTAGLHITDELRHDLAARGVGWAEVTLHVGLDTFRPVTEEVVHEHKIHREWCQVSDETAERIAQTQAAGRRVVAVGTTVARTLETLGRGWNPADPHGYVGMADLFIVPGYRWRIVDALLTNFHLPRSTLLMMVSSFAGWETIRAAYAAAIAKRYRFYSFGDATLLL